MIVKYIIFASNYACNFFQLGSVHIQQLCHLVLVQLQVQWHLHWHVIETGWQQQQNLYSQVCKDGYLSQVPQMLIDSYCPRQKVSTVINEFIHAVGLQYLQIVLIINKSQETLQFTSILNQKQQLAIFWWSRSCLWPKTSAQGTPPWSAQQYIFTL